MALTSLTGVLCAWSALVAWSVLMFTQIMAGALASSTGLPRSSQGYSDDGAILALVVGTLVLLGLAALCFVGASFLSQLDRSALAFAGNIGAVIVLLLGSMMSGGGGWVLLLAVVPVGALISLLIARSATGAPRR